MIRHLMPDAARGTAIWPILTLLVPAAAVSQVRPDVGDRVRMTVVDRTNPLVGTVRAISSDSLALLIEGSDATVSYPMASVTGLEVHEGHRYYGKQGAVIGGAMGAGVGGIVGALAFSDSCLFETDPCPAFGAFGGALLFGSAGLLVGFLVGQMIWSDRWEAIPVDALEVRLTPHRDGLMLRFALRLSGGSHGQRHRQ